MGNPNEIPDEELACASESHSCESPYVPGGPAQEDFDE